MSSVATIAPSLEIRRTLKAPRDRVFEAFTRPEDICKWLGPGPCFCRSAEIDLRKGGAYKIDMSTHLGDTLIVGEYLEVSRPERLVFTWRWEGACEKDFDTKTVTTVTVTLRENAAGHTELTLKHEGFGNEERRDGHTEGWNGSFDKLEALLA